LGWDRPLRFRRGARERLRGIEVYYDFEWSEHFPDRRVQFRGGQNLADLVIGECPDGKRPALLLTDRDDVQQGGRQTDEHHVLVINLPRYVASAEDPGTAQAYLAGLLGSGITLAKRFSVLGESEADDAARWIDEHLDEAALLRWAGNNAKRIELLRQVGAARRREEDDSEDSHDDVERALAALDALEHIDPDVAEAIATIATRDEEGHGLSELLWALTDDDQGRVIAGEMLNARVDERLDDARAAADIFDDLVRTSGETEIHEFLEAHPWLLGLDYARVRPRQPVVRGAVDFLLERFDGFHDFLELKSPNDPLFETVGRQTDIRSPSAFRLSRPLSLALARVHAYRDILSHETTHEEMYGLRHTREPRITILIGRASELTEQEQRILHELNCSLHRVEVVPFDILARRAYAVLDNVKHYLVAAEEQAATADAE
jgi:Domain of unknown function (DUF4263)